MEQVRRLRYGELAKVAEFADRARFLNKTVSKTWTRDQAVHFEQRLKHTSLDEKHIKVAMQGGLLTYLLHCEARVASYLGQGFYTIGPCGEELLGFSTLNMKDRDLAALHYRHVSNSVVRQMLDGKSVSQIALDRARGFTVSSLDPVTGGRHCSIGGDPKREFLVTSTLASQAPAAVGRALAIPLSNRLLGKDAVFAPDAVSYVSLGDGSVNNAHFLSALNLARYSEHGRIKCPTVFVISDNRICISLKGNGYIDKFVSQLQGVHTQVANGQDFVDIFEKSKNVIDYSRNFGRPSLLLISNIPRRFGHAATDRQFAYYSPEEIQGSIDKDPLSDAFSMLLQLGIYDKAELEMLFESLKGEVENAFNIASLEPKIQSRADLVASNSQPLVFSTKPSNEPTERLLQKKPLAEGEERPEVMRKQMTRVFDELLTEDNSVVYIGEDVQHGGYYLVTDGLHKKFPLRVRDFPPDETTLVGATIGFAQSGLTPVLEIPYSKYLDCGADMFYEAVISNWLSNGKQPNGMIVRLQGFDKGIFGGNFHTHNLLSIPPGLDVVCFSNGSDYVRGMRFLKEQAKAGRVVMSVDSTDLLNRRHLSDEKKDEFMLSRYPTKEEKPYHFDEIIVYPARSAAESGAASASKKKKSKKEIVIVTYGNGVPTSLLAQDALSVEFPEHDVVVLETPCLSQTPAQLVDYFSARGKHVEKVVFADVCKQGTGMPLSSRLADLQASKVLQRADWRLIGAAPTYNPLGTYLTFLSVDDIVSAVKSMN